MNLANRTFIYPTVFPKDVKDSGFRGTLREYARGLLRDAKRTPDSSRGGQPGFKALRSWDGGQKSFCCEIELLCKQSTWNLVGRVLTGPENLLEYQREVKQIQLASVRVHAEVLPLFAYGHYCGKTYADIVLEAVEYSLDYGKEISINLIRELGNPNLGPCIGLYENLGGVDVFLKRIAMPWYT